MHLQLPLLETIRLENGLLQNLDRHRARMEHSLACLGLYKELAHSDDWSYVPPEHQQGMWKFRLLYGANHFQVQIEPYTIRPVKSLQLVIADHLEYPVKFADRQAIQTLFQSRKQADDILLVKNGLLTDTSYANIALFDGQHWITPALPLLPGTRRAALLASGKIVPQDIPVEDLGKYQKIRLFNAMMDFEEGPEVRNEE